MPTSQPDCPFCGIVRQADPNVREVFRDEHVVAFFPTSPAVIGHTIVIPREHFIDIWTLSEDSAARLARVTVQLAGAVRNAVNPEGMNIIQSNGPVATQTVFHLHVHLVPRWKGDAMGPIWPDTTCHSEDATSSAFDAVREACQALKK